ncbi:unnamed protein product [Mycena citricolor]|uniref:HTH CENPB-type domain-containing protein n=1 Tax=Mycena citricolor TaxID=2018698 RepID=A0AAD2Q5M1_9AGAR|nr:unnamed protein product [Mycena citricolor]
MQRAVDLYLADQQRPLAPKERRKGTRYFCEIVEEEFRAEYKRSIHLSHMTCSRWAKGKRSRANANAARSWLLPEEAETVLQYVEEMSIRGLPLDHEGLREVVEGILRARLGDDFPEEGLGKNWTQRFLEKHSKRVKTYWSSSLDHKRGRAVNPANNMEWFRLLGDTLSGKMDYLFDEDLDSPPSNGPPDGFVPVPILAENIYGTDESGFFAAGNTKKRVIGKAGTKTQHVQSDGGRENTTVIATICADGTALKPTVIFKGHAYQLSWLQDNPTEANVTYQEKGWTNQEITVEYLRDFDDQTQEKAAGRTCLLVVDGHNSRYSLELLRLARSLRIHILCYPAHGTHVYQGLDVVIFSPLKREWTNAKLEFSRRERQPVNKTNFLKIYGQAHLKAMTETNIKTAFRKTGVWPFNPSVITSDMMAPSLETSVMNVLPVPPTTPVRAISNLMHQMHHGQKRARSPDDLEEGSSARPAAYQRALLASLEDSMQMIRTSSSGYLVNSSPIQSSAQPPTFSPTPISPHASRKRRYARLLGATPTTPLEHDMQEGLRELLETNQSQKSSLVTMQSKMVIHTTYVSRVQGQLEAEEEKKKKKRKGRLVGDGLPRLLTHPDFVRRVQASNEITVQKEAESAQRKETREEREKARVEWKKQDDVRRHENQSLHAIWLADCKAWDAMKAAGQRPASKRPLWKDRKLLNIPKPPILEASGRKRRNQTASAPRDDSDAEPSDEGGSEGDGMDFVDEDEEEEDEED